MSQRAGGELQWPPRSPHDALLSTPGGRNRLRSLAERTSPSPSPVRRSRSTPSLKANLGLADLDEDEDEDDEEEDEEIVLLRLQEIKAKLKLKKLRQAKSKAKDNSDIENDNAKLDIRPLSRAISSASRTRPGVADLRENRMERSKSQVSIHVPASPTRRVLQPEIQRSPSRKLLGIDKGLKASGVSLKRAPSLRNASEDSTTISRRAGEYLQRASSQTGTHGHPLGNRTNSALENARSKATFSERISNVRTQDAERREKDARISQARSKAFDINQEEMEKFKAEADSIPEVQIRPPEFSRDQIMNAYSQPTGQLLQRNKSTSQITSCRLSKFAATSTDSTSRPNPRSKLSYTPANESRDPSEFESFSSLHLSKRIIPHTILTRTMAGKKTFIIPELLKLVVAPNFRLPDLEEDIVLLAILASKSEPRTHKTKATNDERGKYMAISLTDLKWELELFLFGSAFEKFWKLQPGTLIAVLNPGIMPPMNADTGRFSLTLNSSDDTILEIGNARDLGFCKSVKKDGKTCDSWIDKRHTEYCEYHINETLKKTKAGRMEVNTMDFGAKKSGSHSKWGRRTYNSQHVTTFVNPPHKSDGSQYDRESHSRLFISAGRSSANLIDDVDIDPDAFHRGTSKEERMRRQLAAAERENDIACKLASVGGGVGADYMRTRHQPAPDPTLSQWKPVEAPDAMSLGLLGGKASDVHLSPLKRKRNETGSLAIAMGWGGNLTKELGRMKDGERLQPIQKKTRFVTAKGIREAGRESIGTDMIAAVADDDDDDDLDII